MNALPILFSASLITAWAQIPTPGHAPALPDGPFTTVFDGSVLPKDWKMVNAVEDHWTMQPKRKSLFIATQRAQCMSSKAGKNLLLLDRPLPAGDFEVMVRVSASFLTHGSQIGLALWSDDANYFWITYQGDNNYGGLARRFYFQKVSQGQVAGSFPQDLASGDQVYLRIRREDNEYSGFFAVVDPAKPFDTAKIPWTQLGVLPGIRFTGKLALCAANWEDGAPEVGVEFYSVTVRAN